MRVSTKLVQIEHVTIDSDVAYDVVKARLEAEVARLDDSFRALLQADRIDELRDKLAAASRPAGLMIHYVATHGDWLKLRGRPRKGIVYHIGNVLAATEMTQHVFGAALYAPLRLALYENAQGGTTFEFDKPSTQFGQFGNADIDRVGKTLDEKLLGLIEKVGS